MSGGLSLQGSGVDEILGCRADLLNKAVRDTDKVA